MKNFILNFSLILLCIGCTLNAYSQNRDGYSKKNIETGSTTFNYHESSVKSKSVVLIFHDWFGVSDLSYEIGDFLLDKGFDVIIMDLYKGKSAKNNQEAGALMNSIDQENVWNYIDEVVEASSEKYENIILWGFSLGTVPASNTAIKHNQIIDGLILFYGNVTQDKNELSKITFPALMVMGAKDNPQGAINFFNDVNAASGTANLFIYPNARHAFAQKLFNAGGNYNEKAKKASLNVVADFLEGIE